ncbi:MAG TPA: hypothetical protein VN257_01135, partial [Actinotalea sp.]|nr:hypothetical protein [Actinotalea sp.]
MPRRHRNRETARADRVDTLGSRDEPQPGAGRTRGVPTGVRRIVDPAEADALASHLLDLDRPY